MCCASDFSPNRKPVLSKAEGSAIENLKSLNDLIRSRQDIRWNRQSDLLGCFQIDDELELYRLLHREIGGLSAF